MNPVVAIVFVVIAVAAILGWMKFQKSGPPARLPLGFSTHARFTSDVAGTRQLAQKLGRALRALDDPHVTKCLVVKEAESPRVSLQFVDKPSDDGVGFTLLVSHSKSLRDGVEVEVRGTRAQVSRMPKLASQRVIQALASGLTDMGSDVRWSSDGKKWRERPFYN